MEAVMVAISSISKIKLWYVVVKDWIQRTSVLIILTCRSRRSAYQCKG